MLVCRMLMFLLIGLTCSLALAAPDDASKAVAEEADTPAANFAKINSEFRAQISKLNAIRKRYQSDATADQAVKDSLKTEFDQRLDEVRKLEPQLAKAALLSYLAAPDKTPEEHEYLFVYLTGLIQSDDYDQAAKVVKRLIESGYEHKFFNLVAGLAFFGTMDFDNAEKYLTLAKEANELDATGSRYLPLIERHKYRELWAKELKLREAEDKAGDLPKVKLTTSKGDIVIALLENEAPIATANFIQLVEKKFYDGINFHRVIPGFMAQGGDPKGDGTGGPGYTIPDECFEDDHRNHFRGTLSMANTGQRDTGGSQFFLTFLPTAHLDGKHTVFGRVVEGMDVLSKLQRLQPGDAVTPDRIIKATVVSKRNHKYEPVKRPDKS